jgi:hypothetical protein
MGAEHPCQLAGTAEHHPEALVGSQGKLEVELELKLTLFVMGLAFQDRRHGRPLLVVYRPYIV